MCVCVTLLYKLLISSNMKIKYASWSTFVHSSRHRMAHFPVNVFYNQFKDGAYYCYCAYVLRISRYSGFLWVVPTNTGIFLRGLKLYGERST